MYRLKAMSFSCLYTSSESICIENELKRYYCNIRCEVLRPPLVLKVNNVRQSNVNVIDDYECKINNKLSGFSSEMSPAYFYFIVDRAVEVILLPFVDCREGILKM